MGFICMKNLVGTPNNLKRPFGTLYHHRMGAKTHGSVLITPRKLSKRGNMSRTVGAGLTSMAMALYIYSFGPVTQSHTQIVEPTPASVGAVLPAVAADTPKTDDTSFSVYLPYLRTKSDIVANIDAFNESEYKDALSKGVAQAKGTGFPGEGKRIFLFAHSTNSILNIQRYNAIFYDLGNIPNGETVELFYHGKIYQYRVTSQKIVDASDVSWLAPKEGEEVILQTCYPPGTSWKRLLLFASPV